MSDDYKQYTSCCQPRKWVSWKTYLGIAGAALTVIFIPILALAGWCALFYILVAAAAESVAFCTWWLQVRLVCLGGDRSSVGMLVSSERPSDLSGFAALDSDSSINLLPYPALPGVSQKQLEITPPYGELVREQDVTKVHVRFFQGESATEKNGVRSAILHAEFEGAGIRDFLIASTVALGLAIAALIVCVAVPPPWGPVIAGILALLAFLAALFGGAIAAGDTGAPGDVKGTPTELHDNDKTSGFGADLLYVYGTWVFDSLHDGWNELHPIKKCTKVGTWTGAWPTDIVDVQQRLDAGFANARDPATLGRQDEPRYTWEIHPFVDGCGEMPGVSILPNPAEDVVFRG